MASPERALFKKELGDLLSAKSTLSLLILSSFLIGYGFIQAVELYSEASRAALEHRELAAGMNPFEGILVPTLGSLYLITTLLFPFVAIRAISGEKQTATLKLLLQLPVPFSRTFLVKGLVVFLGWALSTLPALLSVGIWFLKGGHANAGELFSLLLGHGLYASAVIGIAFLIASITQSSASAALSVLAVTLGSWVLDFSVSSVSDSWVKSLSFLSLTAGIRPFERGLILSQALLRFLLIGSSTGLLSFFCLSQPGIPSRKKAKFIGIIFGALVSVALLVSSIRFHADLSEDRRNSFPKVHEEILQHLPNELEIRIALSPDDPRYKDLQRNVLSKLERTVPWVSISLAGTGKSTLFGVGSDDAYGLNEYRYQGKVETSRSTSPRELLPLIYRLAGVSAPEVIESSYPGYPMVLDPTPFSALFYILLPILFLCLWWWHHRIPNIKGGIAK